MECLGSCVYKPEPSFAMYVTSALCLSPYFYEPSSLTKGAPRRIKEPTLCQELVLLPHETNTIIIPLKTIQNAPQRSIQPREGHAGPGRQSHSHHRRYVALDAAEKLS